MALTKLEIAGISLIPFVVVVGSLAAVFYSQNGGTALSRDMQMDAWLYVAAVAAYFGLSYGIMHVNFDKDTL